MIRVIIELPEEKVEQLTLLAYRKGYLREDPQKRWSKSERSQAIKYAIYAALEEKVGLWSIGT